MTAIDLSYELNLALAAASRLADRLESSYNTRPPQSQPPGTAEARGTTSSRLSEEHAAAVLAELRCVNDSLWWATADPYAIGRAYARARSLRGYLQDAAAAEETIRSELSARFAIDLDRVGGPPQLVQDQYERYELERLRRASMDRMKESSDNGRIDACGSPQANRNNTHDEKNTE